jgi:hypothetical protein
MLRCILLRLALPALLSALLTPAATFAQSQDTPSVAEAARRAREQKKTSTKPARVITEDDVKPAAPDAAPASGFPAPAAGGAPNPPAAQTPAGASGADGSKDPKDQKDSQEVVQLKEQLKQAQSDLDLMQRELALAQDTYFSNPDYAHDTAGKAKLDAQKLQIGDKQEEVARLKARLLELQPPPDTSGSATAPAPPTEPAAQTPPPKP